METKKVELEEFYNLVRNDKLSIQKKLSGLNNDFNVFDMCGTKEKFIDNILNKNIDKKLVELLKIVFGPNFFEDLNKEQINEFKRNNILTKYDLREFLIVNNGDFLNYNFKMPNNYEEFKEYIKNVYKVLADSRIPKEKKDGCILVANVLNGLINDVRKRKKVLERDLTITSKIYDKFINCFSKNVSINFSQEDINFIKQFFNASPSKFYVEDQNNKDVEIGYGDAFLKLSEEFNDELLEKAKEKEERKIESKAKKYYKKLSKIEFDKLENENVPKYTNEKFYPIMNKLIDMFNENLIDDDNYLLILGALHAHRMAYFKTPYSDIVFKDKETNLYKTK